MSSITNTLFKVVMYASHRPSEPVLPLSTLATAAEKSPELYFWLGLCHFRKDELVALGDPWGCWIRCNKSRR